MSNNQKGITLSVQVTDIKFDPEDDTTKGLNPRNVSFFIYKDS